MGNDRKLPPLVAAGLAEYFQRGRSTPWWVVAAKAAVRRGEFHVIERAGRPYLLRTWIGRGPRRHRAPGRLDSAESSLLHWFVTSDPDPHRHSHPWSFTSTVLSGGYAEEIASPGAVCTVWRRAGETHEGHPDTIHRVAAILPGTWTMLRTGPRVSRWGFAVDGAIVSPGQYTKARE